MLALGNISAAISTTLPGEAAKDLLLLSFMSMIPYSSQTLAYVLPSMQNCDNKNDIGTC